jgi:uncharacterized protein
VSRVPQSAPVQIEIGPGRKLLGLLLRPEGARALLVLAHGAGAGMDHPFMDGISRALAGTGIATLRYPFPYMAAGGRRPDPRPLLLATVRAAVATAGDLMPGLPLLAGGKSMGGRMTSQAAAEAPLPGPRGLVFLGFPLHPAGRPATGRADHLAGLDLPLLFLQGERDRLCDLSLLRPVIAGLSAPTTLHVVADADHGFHVPRRSGRTDADVLADLARAVAAWVAQIAPAGLPRAL